MKKRFSLIALLAVFALVLAACSSDSSDDTTTTVAEETTTTTEAPEETTTTTVAETTTTEAPEETTTTTEAPEETTTTTEAPADPTIADIVVEAASADPAEFTILLAAVQAADPIVLETLSDPSQTLTVFAPTDEAFTNLLADLGLTAEELLAYPDLNTILLYHVLGSEVTSGDLVAAGEETIAQTLAEIELLIRVTDEGSVVFPDAGGGMVVTADVSASNGVVHIVDSVLVPPGLDF